jgi:hypothetical protein
MPAALPIDRGGFGLGAVALACLFLLAPSALAAAQVAPNTAEPPPPPVDGVPGNLALISLESYELTGRGGDSRLLLRALVENQTPVDREGPFEVVFSKRSGRNAELGVCRGELLPQGQLAVCELWLPGTAVREGQTIEAELSRQAAGFDEWDAKNSDDSISIALRTMPESGEVLRIASFAVEPQVLQGMGEVHFRFHVEGGHLVWLINQDEPPELVAGHPSDGLLSGRGTVKVKRSGPITLVARNSLGAFVYQTVPVSNLYAPPKKTWVTASSEDLDEPATARVLDVGVFDVDEDAIILDELQSYLATKDWASLQDLAPKNDDDPKPASVLNPGREQR